jgi:hypothetical protein
VDGGQQRGKQTMLARAMSTTGWLHSLCEQGLLPPGCAAVERVDFSNSALTDEEFAQVRCSALPLISSYLILPYLCCAAG